MYECAAQSLSKIHSCVQYSNNNGTKNDDDLFDCHDDIAKLCAPQSIFSSAHKTRGDTHHSIRYCVRHTPPPPFMLQ